MKCTICGYEADVAVGEDEGGEEIYLCSVHNEWPDQMILDVVSHLTGDSPPQHCHDCGGNATERQRRQGREYLVCGECAYVYVKQEIERYS